VPTVPVRAGLLLVAILCVPFVSRPATAAIDQARLAAVGFEQRVGTPLPPALRFRDQDGREVAVGDLIGDVPLVIAPLFYECPDLCGLMLQGLAETLQQIDLKAGRDFRVVLLGIDPRETPAIAARHRDALAARFPDIGIGQGWTSLTGQQTSISALTEALGFRYAYDSDSGQYVHMAGIVLVTPGGVIGGYLLGAQYRPRDLTLGLVDNGEGRIGRLADRIVLPLYDVDPHTGRYALPHSRLLRRAGIGTVALLILLIAARSVPRTRWPGPVPRKSG
jgi:protein SCO1/2